MTRSHFPPRLTVTTVAGVETLVTTASVRVLQPGTTALITGSVYTTATGGTTRSQPWTPTDGVIDFYLNTAQTVRIGITFGSDPETYLENIDVGAVLPWRRSVLDYGATGNGSTDDSGAIQLAINSMSAGNALFFPVGTYVVGTTIQLPTVDGASLIAPTSPQNRLGAAVLRAKNGSNLPAIAATQEWLTSGTSPDTAQGLVIEGLGFDGGGFRPGSVHLGVKETTSNTNHGLVVHGSGFKLNHIFIVSANGNGLHIPGLGLNGSAVMGESHEGMIFGCGIRYTGADGIFTGTGQQDTWVEMCKIQYAGNHCINITDSPGWSIVHCHPSWGWNDTIHVEGAWQTRIIGNYVGSVGYYGDGSAVTHNGIYVKGGPSIVTGNSINLNAGSVQTDPVNGIKVQNGPVICKDNSLIYATGNTITMVAQAGISSPSIVADNMPVAT